MATLADVRQLALGLPDTAEDARHGETPSWKVHGKLFVWERPLRKSDLIALGDSAPTGTVLGARVPDEAAKLALVESQPDIYFTTPHFNGYPAVLIRLDVIDVDELEETVVEAWLAQAPVKTRKAYLAAHDADNPLD